MAESPTVAVVGAGIIGASIAWHLAKGGARVIVLAPERGGVATPNSFAWINASRGNPEPYFRLRIRSMAEWRRLGTDVPAAAPNWCGGLCFDLPAGELEAYAREHSAWGYGIRPVDRKEIALLEPDLAEPPDEALFIAEEGAVEPDATARALLADAVRRGTEIRPATVTALTLSGDRVTGVETAEGRLAVDHVVVAAGTGTPALAASVGIGIPIEAPSGLLVQSRPHAKLVNRVVNSPGLHFRQTADGRIVAGADYGGSAPGEDGEATARLVFETLKAKLRGGDALQFARYSVGYRPTPADEFPVIGGLANRPGLYLAVMHSGITLAPAVGLFAAEEILAGRRDPLLASYGPERFASDSLAVQ